MACPVEAIVSATLLGKTIKLQSVGRDASKLEQCEI